MRRWQLAKSTEIILACIATLSACSPVKQQIKQDSTIDEKLQVVVDSLLRQQMQELDAISGRAIVMEVQTGELKASVGNDSILQESGLTRAATLLVALETGKVKLSDRIDMGNGELAIGTDTLRDHNWHRGGYGELTVMQSFGVASNIANYLIAKKALGNEEEFAKALAKYDYQVKDTSLVYNPIGYGIPTTPMQNTEFFNTIARRSLANEAVADSMIHVMEYAVAEGLAKPAASEKVRVAGATGNIRLAEDEYVAEFCGYFPADKPQYTILVGINKKGLPVSGGQMAGSVFCQIADYMIAP
ncbi:MAG: penicillin-binding transpeptidase domain-containing protein [Mediterranea sp.]|nr:penicillin-binding transpeptidase domain-containing protein [Mediterranea sp.]